MAGLFTLDVGAVAVELTNRTIILPGGSACRPTEAQAYPRADNAKGAYKPMLGMRPGDVFVSRVQSSLVFLVVSKDSDGIGACVLIRAAEIGGHKIVGPGRVGAAIGVTEHRQTGRLDEQADGTLVLTMDGALQPAPPPSPKLTEKAIQSRMADISRVIVHENAAGVSLESLLGRIRSECKTVADLDALLARGA